MSTFASDEKTSMDDTLKSPPSVFVDEKATEADGSTIRGSTGKTEVSTETERDNERKEASVEVKEESLTRIMTSQDGVEYPQGMKLGLISLALCLSVFLIALVRRCAHGDRSSLTLK